MSTVILIVLLLLFLGGVDTSSQIREGIDDIIDECYDGDPKRHSCYANLLMFNRPINCSLIHDQGFINCTQEKLFPEDPTSFKFRECCGVFKHNDNDPNKYCFNQCKDLANTPSINVTTKLAFIQHCQQPQGLIQCFKLCLPQEHFQFFHYCNVSDLIPPDITTIHFSSQEMKEHLAKTTARYELMDDLDETT